MKKLKVASILFLSFLMFTVVSCDNEPLEGFELESNDTNGGGSGSGGNGSGSGTGNSGGDSTGDYWPMAVNNSWTYNFNIDGVPQEDSSIDMTDLVDYQGAPSYLMNYFGNNPQTTDGTELGDVSLTSYARKNGGDYWVFIASTTIEIEGIMEVTQSAYDYAVLKDYKNVGETWDSNYAITSSYVSLLDGFPAPPDTTINVEAHFEILERDATLTVNDQVYSPVIKVRQFNTYITPGVPNSTAQIDTYFAEDVGIIKSSTTSLDGDDNITTVAETNLSSYTLN